MQGGEQGDDLTGAPERGDPAQAGPEREDRAVAGRRANEAGFDEHQMLKSVAFRPVPPVRCTLPLQ
jgi:hypothetical protein